MTNGKPVTLLALGERTTDFYQSLLDSAGLDIQRVDSEFDEHINPYLPDRFNALEPGLRVVLERCRDADQILMPNITLHRTLDRLDPEGKQYPVVHAVRETIGRLQRDGYRSVTLLGSGYTMRSDYPQSLFAEAGIEVQVPDRAEQAVLDQIRRKIYAGQEDRVNLQSYEAALAKYGEQGPVVLACTEFSLVTPPGSGIWDMARLSIEAIGS